MKMKKLMMVVCLFASVLMMTACRRERMGMYEMDTNYNDRSDYVYDDDQRDDRYDGQYDDDDDRYEQRNRRSGRPDNPEISLERAREIAEAYLAERGVEAAVYRESGVDREDGRWVWELEFRTDSCEYEFYIDMETGEILDFDQEYSD